MTLLDGVDQSTVALLLGTDRTGDFAESELEHPDCLAVMWPEETVRGEALGVRGREEVRSEALNVNGEERREIPLFLDSVIVREMSGATGTRWYGKANRLSGEHGVEWEVIDEAAEASWKHTAESRSVSIPLPYGTSPHSLPLTPHSPSAGQVIRQRRSAVAYDGKTSITSSAFFHLLQRVMPKADRSQLDRPMPWDVWPYDPAIHLMVFVHRVDGLTPGVYFLVRDRRKLQFVQESVNGDITWVSPPGCPEDLPLYWLLEGDARGLAVQVSCRQDIAGDSAFSLGMLAEFEGGLRERGGWWYPRLFWEAGLVGQVLYLEAEAAGVRATGIGCFFDDPVHEIVAVRGLSLQSLYHFTIGGPVEDSRLQTLPPYHHIKREE